MRVIKLQSLKLRYLWLFFILREERRRSWRGKCCRDSRLSSQSSQSLFSLFEEARVRHCFSLSLDDNKVNDWHRVIIQNVNLFVLQVNSTALSSCQSWGKRKMTRRKQDCPTKMECEYNKLPFFSPDSPRVLSWILALAFLTTNLRTFLTQLFVVDIPVGSVSHSVSQQVASWVNRCHVYSVRLHDFSSWMCSLSSWFARLGSFALSLSSFLISLLLIRYQRHAIDAWCFLQITVSREQSLHRTSLGWCSLFSWSHHIAQPMMIEARISIR